MRRRDFITLVGGSALAWSLSAQAQQVLPASVPKIGILLADHDRSPSRFGGILTEALAGFGYVDGKTARIIQLIPPEQSDISNLARGLVDEKVDVIVAVSVVGAIEIHRLTRTIPIVVVFASDILKYGFVESLSHPGGNVTGLSLASEDLHGKRLSLLREAVPTITHVTMMFNPISQFSKLSIDEQLLAAKSQGIPARPLAIETPDAMDQAFAGLAGDGTEGVTFSTQPMMARESSRIAAAALAHRIPTIGYHPGMARDGLLMAYGQDYDEYPRKAASYVDKILKGAKPADLPIEQPTKFELVINLKTAKAIGVSIPASLLVSADEVIE